MAIQRSSLSEFVLELSRNPQTLAQFRRDPQATARQAGLSPEAVQAVVSKDPARIQQAILDEKGETADPSRFATDIVIVIVI